jgi:hypothetical protein
MAWWRRSKKPGTVSVLVFDPTAVTGPFQRPGLVVGGRQLPPITAPSFTDRIAEQTRAGYPAGTGSVGFVAPHYTFTEDGSARYMGLCGRAVILVRLTPDLRADLYDLGEAIEASGASLYLDAHPGFLRASLLLPSMDFELDTGMLLSVGNVQEFLQAAYVSGTVELHISHSTHDRLLPFTCVAAGIRAVLDAGFDLITRPAPADLHTSLAAVNHSLNSSALVPLRVTGRADLTIGLDIEV